jgi:pimeloyl-ACP methyl ester carboxylesterase
MRFRRLLVLSSAVIGLACAGSTADALAGPRGEWKQLVGWYRLGDGREVLLTWAADGDLRLAAPSEPYFSHPFRSQSGGSFLWQHTKDGTEETRTVAFATADADRPRGFDWTTEDGASGFAPRLNPQPYELRELEYRNQQVRLSGTLLLPNPDEPVPAAAMVHGSGDSDRDNLWYLAIADHLARNGIAVLLPDKRGCGRSGGDWRTSSMEDFARDTQASVAAIRGIPGIDRDRVGLFGISQGGRIAPLAADGLDTIAFVVNVSGGVLPVDESLLHESRQTLRQKGMPGWMADAFGPFAAAVAKRRNPVWWEKNETYYPLPYWRSLEVPALIVYGAEDERDNVPVKRSVGLLEELQPSVDLTVEVFPDSGHGLFVPDTQTIRPEVLELFVSWIRAKVPAS